MKLSWNSFERLELDLDCLVYEEKSKEKKGFQLRIILSDRGRGRKEVGLRIICPSKREKNRRAKPVRRGVRSPVR